MPTKPYIRPPQGLEAAPKVMKVQSRAVELLNSYELQSIYNLFAWVAEEQDTAKETVESITAAHFAVDDASTLAAQRLR